MKELQDYVNKRNEVHKLFKNPILNLNVYEDRLTIAEHLSCDLSPENLTCDGELPTNQVKAKFNYLMKIAKQLIKLDPSIEVEA